MIFLNSQQVEKLSKFYPHPVVSVLVPTHRAGQEVLSGKDALELKNTLKEAESLLVAKGMAKSVAEKLLKPGYELVEDRGFWHYQSDGLALYFDTETGEMEQVQVPVRFDNVAYVGNHYYLKPLAPLMAKDRSFFILALSENEVKLYQGTRYAITRIRVSDLIPGSKSEIFRQEGVDNSVYFHSHESADAESAIFHGHGDKKDRNEIERTRFFNKVDEGLQEILNDMQVPLVLAATEEALPEYAKVNTYNHLVEDDLVRGNPEHMTMTELHEKAMPLVQDYLYQELTDQSEAFAQQQHLDSTLVDPGDIVRASREGRIETLFTDDTSNVWGQYHPDTHQIDLHSERQTDSECLLNRAVLYAVSMGAHVFNLPRAEMPTSDENPVAAILRT